MASLQQPYIPSPDGLNGREGDARIAREHVRKVALNEVLEEKLESYLSLFENQTLRAAFSQKSSRFSGAGSEPFGHLTHVK